MEDKKDNAINSLLIDKMMDKFNYFPNDVKFESVKKEISDEANFSKIFNTFLTKLKEFDSFITNHISLKKIDINYICSHYYTIDSDLINYMENKQTEVEKYIKDIWKEQMQTNVEHTCFFIILVDKYIERSKKISEYEKNILFWTILYHDLGKYKEMNPFIKEDIDIYYYDKTHPFKSIIIFLNSAFEHELFFYPNDEYKNELINIYKEEFINSIFDSWNLEKYKKKERYNICYKHIDVIEKFFMKIKSQEKNEWIYDICILIIFHQSLPNNEYCMNSPLLDEKYIKLFFTKRLVELMRIIMVYDSASHTMFFGSNWPEEINKNIDKITKLFE